MVQITINGKQMEVPEGTTVLRAAEMAGIYIPRLCDQQPARHERAESVPLGGNGSHITPRLIVMKSHPPSLSNWLILRVAVTPIAAICSMV